MLNYAVVVGSIVVPHSVYQGSMIIDQQSTINQQVMSVFSRINDASVFLTLKSKKGSDHLRVETLGGLLNLRIIVVYDVKVI